MAVITISRQFGAGGKTLGKMIAEALDYTFVDSDIVTMIANAANVSETWVENIEREAGNKLSRAISMMVNKSLVDKVLKSERGYMDEQIYLDYLVVMIAQIAEEGNAVILGRGSQYILNDHPDAFHILLIDEFENRVKFMMDHYDMNQEKATQTVKNEDKRRMSLFRKIGKTDYDKPQLYHMVLNMRRLNLETAKKLTMEMIKLMQPRVAV